MSVTKIFAVTLLVSTGAAFAPAFAEDGTGEVLQVAAVEAQLPINPATEAVPAAPARDTAAWTAPVLSAEEVRARLFGRAPVAQSNDPEAQLIRDVAAMYQFQHYRPVGTFGTDVAGSDTYETAAYVAEAAQN